MTVRDHAPHRAAAPRVVRVVSHLRVHPVGDAVLLVGEDGVRTVRGRAAAVVPLLDGTLDLDGVVAAAPAGLGADETRAAVRRLVHAGLVEIDVAVPDPRGTFHRAACGPELPARPAARVGLVDLGDPEETGAVASALECAGCEVGPADGSQDCVVVAVADHLDPRLADLDTRLRQTGTPWLPVRARGIRSWLGPFVGAVEDGPCWHCLAVRLWGHRRGEESLQAGLGAAGPLERSLPVHPSSLGMVAHAVALEVDAWRHGWSRPITRGIVVHDHRAGTSALHELRRRPQCPGCGDPGLQARRGEVPVALTGPSPGDDARPELVTDGYQHLVSPVTGVVATVADVPSPVGSVHLARTGPTLPARAVGLSALRAWAGMGNGGSGATAPDARSAALGEALERWSGQFHGDEARVRARYADLGDEAVDPRSVLLVDPSQSRDPGTWNAGHGPFNQIGPEVDDTEECDWTPLWSLRDGTRRLLPTAMLFHGAPGPAWAVADSTGCAAGRTRDDAIRRGLLELVERDAVALWWYHRAHLGEVPIDGADRAAHRAVGRDVWALDLTSDLGVPVVAAVSARAGRGDRVMVGFAADLDPATATTRALRELAAGTAVTVEGGATPTDPDSRRWFDEVDVHGEEWLRPCGRSRPATVDGDVEAIVHRLVGHGLEPLVLDQTRLDVGLPVVRTVVPGLRPMWARFAPGRLFDVPVALGRRPDRARIEDLNPRAVFL